MYAIIVQRSFVPFARCFRIDQACSDTREVWMETRIVQLQSDHQLNILWKRCTCGLYDIRYYSIRGMFAIISTILKRLKPRHTFTIYMHMHIFLRRNP